jgi:hypothetical protein
MKEESLLVDLLLRMFGEPKNVNEYSGQMSVDCPVCSYDIKGLSKDIDKKEIIWKKVSDKEPQITWLYTRNNTLKKECFDMSDSYTCVLGYMKQENTW